MSDTPVEDLLSTVLRAYNLRAGIYGHPAVCGDYQFGTAGDGQRQLSSAGHRGMLGPHTHRSHRFICGPAI